MSDTPKSASQRDVELGVEEMARYESILLEYGLELGLDVLLYPRLKTNFCMAVKQGTAIIGHDGTIYRCDKDLGDPKERHWSPTQSYDG